MILCRIAAQQATQRCVHPRRSLPLPAENEHGPAAQHLANEGFRPAPGRGEDRPPDGGRDAVMGAFRLQCRQQRLPLAGRHVRPGASGPVHFAMSVQPGPRRSPERRGFGDLSCRAWAMLIKRVYEVDPLECPQCGGVMKIISFIERGQQEVVERILRHCGLWEGPIRTLAGARAPPHRSAPSRRAGVGHGSRVS